MKMVYTTADEKYRRLHNTVCVYKGIPVFVNAQDYLAHAKIPIDMVGVSSICTEDDADLNAVLQGVPSKQGYRFINYQNDDFEAHDIPLGYSKAGGTYAYFVRVPNRTFQQGLNTLNTMALGEQKISGSYLFNSGFSDCIRGKYPSITQCFENLDKKTLKSCAFSRDYALSSLGDSKIVLDRKGKTVGIANIYNTKFVLFDTPGKRLISLELENLGVDHTWEA